RSRAHLSPGAPTLFRVFAKRVGAGTSGVSSKRESREIPSATRPRNPTFPQRKVLHPVFMNPERWCPDERRSSNPQASVARLLNGGVSRPFFCAGVSQKGTKPCPPPH